MSSVNGLARDIQRYLADEPVEARPPSARYRLGKFPRRNKGPVLAAGLVLLALVVGMVGTTWGMLHAERRHVEAEQAQLREAEQRGKAEQARDRTRQALDAMTSSVTGDSLTTQKTISEEQKKFLTEVLSYYREFASEMADGEQARARTAAAAMRVGAIEYRLGRIEEAALAFRQARDGYAQLADDFPAVPQYRQELAKSHNDLGILLAGLGKHAEAEQQYRQALVLFDKMAAEYPAVPQYRKDLALSHNSLGVLLAGLGQGVGAEKQFCLALALQQKLVDDFPAMPDYQINLGGSCGGFGNLLSTSGQPSESLIWYDKAIRTLTAVYEQDRRLVLAKQFLRNSHWNRARAYDRLRKYTEAINDWDKAIELSPKHEQPSLRTARASARINAGQVAEAVAEVAELMKTPHWDAGQWYDFACVYAVASSKIADKKQEYADRAMQLLHQTVKAGWKDAAHMSKDTDLDSLRERDDFKNLMHELQKKPATGKEKQP